METLLAFAIAFLITMTFVVVYVRRLTRAQAKRPCGRCSRPVPADSKFCCHCEAPLAPWSVQSAPATPASTGASSGRLHPVINASLCIGCGSCVTACPEQGTLEMAGGKAILAHPERCMAHGDCVTACPTSGIVLTGAGVLQTMRVPLVQANFETNVPGLYIIGELGGLGLIKTSINEGKALGDHLKNHVEKCPTPPAADADVIIVGAGPAGLSASLTLHKYGVRYITVEQGEVASTIRKYPRHKFLMAEPLHIPLYGDLYIADSTKEALLEAWEKMIASTGVQIRTNEPVLSIQREESTGLLVVSTPQGSYRAPYAVLAIGKRGTPRKLGVPGEEQSHVTYGLIEAESYKDQDVLVIGAGDSALEAALALSKDRANQVILALRGTDFPRARARNRERVHEAEKKGTIRVLRESQFREIRSQTVLLESAGQSMEVPAHFVFVLIGGEPPEDLLRRCGVEMVEKAIAA